MNLHNDLLKAKITHNCEQCYMNCTNCSTACNKFHPENMTEFMDYALECIRGMVEPSKERTLKRYAVRDSRSYNDKVSTLDYYYVLLVNSVLSEIRKGKTDYVYSFEQIKDIMRFESDISVRYIADAEAYEIRKAG